MAFHTEVQLVAFIGLVHLWIPFTGYVFDGEGSGDNGDINDRSLAHGHELNAEVCLDRLEDLLSKVAFIEQIPGAENPCLIRDWASPIFVDSCLRVLLINNTAF